MDNKKRTIHDPEVYNLTRHRDQKFKRGASFLLLFNREKQLEILRGLTAGEQEGMLEEIALTGDLSTGEIKKLKEEFDVTPENEDPGPRGGKEKAAELRKALAREP